MDNCNSKKELKINFFIPITVLVIGLFISFKIYAYTSNDSKQNLIENTLVTDNDADMFQEETINNEEVYEIKQYTAENGETYNIVGTIEIPSLNIKYPIMSEYTETLLKIAPTKYWGSNPNRIGNMVILGHNYKNTKFFSKLPKIKKDDIIKITDTNGKTLEYSVYDTYIIEPDDNTCTSQLTDGKIEITLITCYYTNKNAVKRFVVKARAN